MEALLATNIVNCCGHLLFNSDGGNETEGLASHLESLARIAGFPLRLRELGIAQAELQSLAELATQQWTGQFNPRLFNAAGALEIYQAAY